MKNIIYVYIKIFAVFSNSGDNLLDDAVVHFSNETLQWCLTRNK